MQISRFFKGAGSQSEQTETVEVISPEKENIYSDLIERWRSVVELNPSDKNARLQLLDTYANADLWDDATSLADELRSEFPDDYHVLVCFGRVIHKKGDIDAEISFWTDLSKRFPDATDPLVGLAKIAAFQDNLDEAIIWADRALKIKPSDNRAILVKAKIYQREGKSEDAITAYMEILSTEPGHYESEANLSSALLKVERYDELLERLDSSIKRHPEKPAFKMCLFRAHCKLQNHDTALDIIDALLDQDIRKHKAEYYVEKSDLLLKLGRNDEADAVCEAAIQLYPKHIKLLTLYARVGQRKLNTA